MKKRKNLTHCAAVWLALSCLMTQAITPAIASTARARQQKQEQRTDESHTQDTRGRVVFASDLEDNFEIYLINPEGGALTKVTDDPAEDIDPTFAPDGNRIAFVSNRDGNQEIYVTGTNGGTATRLTNNAAADLDPAWSPDGSKIAFTSERDGNQNIYVMNADGSNVVRLTDDTGADFRPAWSPDGSKIAFTTNRDGNEEIYVMSANGSGQTNVSNNAADDLNPSWSPMRITFQSTRDGNDEIYSMNENGSGQTRLTNDPGFDGRPARSSDGSRVYFVSNRADENLELYSMNSDGSDIDRLTTTEGSEFDPSVQSLTTIAPAGSIQFSASTFTVNEGAGRVSITITRTGNTTVAAAVDFATVSGTASDRSDFAPISVTVEFAANETSKSIDVPIIDDAFTEPDETFTVTLGNATGAELGAINSATVTIVDNDSTPPTVNPIDDASFFVRQQYLDFLSREPDAAGLAFWTNELNRLIAACPASPAATRASCVLGARAQVSTAFFLSIEFQETGYFVIRAYLEAFNRLPTFREFLEDVQDVRRGVIVGQAGALERLAANRREFLDRFVNREEFRARYAGTSNSDYVNALFTNAGAVASSEAATRDALINGLNNGTETRATAIQKVADTKSVFNAAYNRAFVLMEYFGYLRRDPDAPGFQFWLNKLNSVSQPNEDVRDSAVALARIRRAQMVEAFIDSTEYRQRFGRP